MAKIRITKEFSFEMAHALWNYDGLCRNIHGHSYVLSVTITGEPEPDNNNPKFGMIIDFGDLKEIINKTIIDIFDHSIVIYNKAPLLKIQEIDEMFDKKIVSDYQPTCENLILDFVQRIKPELPPNTELFSLKLHETATSYAEWYAGDN